MRTLVTALLALGSCSPSVEGYLSDHRAEAQALFQRVRAAQAALPSAPAGEVPFAGAIGSAVTTVAVEDFDALSTEPDGQPFHELPRIVGRPRLGRIEHLAAALREAPVTSYARSEVERLDESLADLRALRQVIVVQTLEWHPNSDAAPRSWSGRALVWDLSTQQWTGAFSVRVVDAHTYSRGLVWVTNRGRHSGDVSPEEQASIFTSSIDQAVSRAVALGASQELVANQQGELVPQQSVAARAVPAPPSAEQLEARRAAVEQFRRSRSWMRR